MIRNVFDFDKTIFDGDSTVRFFRHCAVKYPCVILEMFASLWWFAGVKLRLTSKTQAKERFYRFLSHVPDVENEVLTFWAKNAHKVKHWYLERHCDNNLVISASPEFLLKPICQSLHVPLIASRVDPCTGNTDGLNCDGQEKVVRLYEMFPDARIDVFYSDSRSDTPLALLARQAYFVRGNHIENWQLK